MLGKPARDPLDHGPVPYQLDRSFLAADQRWSGYNFNMSTFMALLYIFFQKYLVPLIYVIGLMNFIYGCIEYYVAGRAGGDEGRAHNGKLYLLRSLSWFFVGLMVYCVISFFGWLTSGAWREALNEDAPAGDFGVDFDERQNTLGVPNVPRGNDE